MMSGKSRRTSMTQRVGAPIAALLVVALSGCGLSKVDVPPLSGPSTFGFSVSLTITPDVLLADAVSTASIVATLRGPDGKPVSGRAVFFAVTDENFNFLDLGTLQSTVATFPNPGPQVTEFTQGNGIAQVIYRVPERISLTAIERVHIIARLVGDDAQGQTYKSVTVELRPAEVRRFPPLDGNTKPTCDFFVDPPVGPDGGSYPTSFTIRFKSTSSDPDPGDFIARYFWDFGDGHQEDGKPDVQHAFFLPGTYIVTHVVTDSHGGQSDCTLNINIK
jgi:PKD repeat protein